MIARIKEAKGLSLWLLNLFNFDAWASNWNTIYIRKEYINDGNLIRHELTHIKQIEKDGRFWQPIKYMYYLVRYGYKNNPYEIEARANESI